jgi:PilZ domain
MERDRRSAPRVRVKLHANWEGVLCHDVGTVTDLSRTGCFVLTGGKVQIKELIWLEISLPYQPPVHFWGEVVDVATEIGFAVRFNAGSDDDRNRLAAYIETLFESPPKKST